MNLERIVAYFLRPFYLFSKTREKTVNPQHCIIITMAAMKIWHGILFSEILQNIILRFHALPLLFFIRVGRRGVLNFFSAKLSKYLWNSWIKSIRGVVSLCHKTFFRNLHSRLLLNFRATCIYMIIFQCKFMQQYCSSIFMIFTKFIKFCKKKCTAYNSLLCGNVHKVFFCKKIKRF